MRFEFKSRVEPLHHLTPLAHENVIRDEPMLFSAGWDFAQRAGGMLTRWALSRLQEDEFIQAVRRDEVPGRFVVIDTRSHMLMRDMIPAIPGWHCDGVPRRGFKAQPDLASITDTVKHYVVTVASETGGISNTRYWNGDIAIDVDEERVWGSVDTSIRATLAEHESLFDGRTHPALCVSEDGWIYRFDQRTLHEAAPAHARGWRWFFRLTTYPFPPRNEVRKQTQVYMDPGTGW